jgi:hypothetical protein
MHARARIRLLRRRTRRAGRAVRLFGGRVAATGRWAARHAIVLGVIAVLAFGAGATVAVLYGQFGFHPGRNADAWASRQPQFATATGCGACHADQATRWATAAHVGVTCESCHGPLVGHPAATLPDGTTTPSSPAPVALISLAEATAPRLGDGAAATTLCLTCHQAIVGRPLSFPAIDPARHFSGPACIVCHDPHTAAAPHPPQILHSLTGLPECTVCHSPSGLRPLPDGHPVWVGDCRACHTPVQS